MLITGMSGTGKSTALQVLGERGHRVVDTDTGQWSHWVRLPDGSTDWVWREDAITALLADHRQGPCSWLAASRSRGSSTPGSIVSSS
jgi:predicted ATPase